MPGLLHFNGRPAIQRRNISSGNRQHLRSRRIRGLLILRLQARFASWPSGKSRVTGSGS